MAKVFYKNCSLGKRIYFGPDHSVLPSRVSEEHLSVGTKGRGMSHGGQETESVAQKG